MSLAIYQLFNFRLQALVSRKRIEGSTMRRTMTAQDPERLSVVSTGPGDVVPRPCGRICLVMGRHPGC